MNSSTFICSLCGKGYTQKRNLVEHENNIHHKMRKYSCCGIGFTSKVSLKRHRCRTHGEVKAYVCATCRKEFATKNDLVAHEKREQKELTHKCDTCGHQTANVWEMQQHLATHSNVHGEVCMQCGKHYKHPSSLARHMRKKHTA